MVAEGAFLAGKRKRERRRRPRTRAGTIGFFLHFYRNPDITRAQTRLGRSRQVAEVVSSRTSFLDANQGTFRESLRAAGAPTRGIDWWLLVYLDKTSLIWNSLETTSYQQPTRRAAVKEKGIVKWFNGAKGYGFIQRSTGEDVFVHFSAIQADGYRSLNEGEAVEFELQQGPKGLNAIEVTRPA